MSSPRRSVVALAALLVTALALASAASPSRAGAQDEGAAASADLDEDARLHFELGGRAYERGDFTTAAEEFEEAYELSRRPGLLYNMYVALRDAQDRPGSADALRRFLAAADPDIPNRARLEVVLTQLEAELAAEVEASAEAEPAVSSGDPAPVDVTGPGLVLMFAAAAGISALFTGGFSIARNEELTGACPSGACPESARGLHAEVEALSIATDVLWPTATVAFLGGMIYLLFAMGQPDPSSESAALRCGPTGCRARTGGVW